MLDPTCPFCAIAAGLDRTVEEICRTEFWVAFFPSAPATLGHTLVIPRVHVRHLWLATPALAASLMAGVVEVGHAIQTALRPEGMNLISSAGIVAEQSVPHLHLHVVPRWEDDRIDQIWPPKTFTPKKITHEVANLVRSNFRSPSGLG